MAIRFKVIKLDDPALFGVQLTGSVNRTDKVHLERLAEKCLANGKSELIVDFSEVTTIGGSGAMILAEFQRQLIASDGEAVFVGAGQVARRFLEQSFGNLPMRCYASIAAAQEDYYTRAEMQAQPAISAERAADSPATASDECAVSDDGAVACAVDEGSDRDLDSLLGAVPEDDIARFAKNRTADPTADSTAEATTEATTEATVETQSSDTSSAATTSRKPAAEDAPTSGRRQYLSLEEAVATLDLSSDSEVVGEALANLMHSYDLAQEIVYFTRKDDFYTSADGQYRLAGDGPLIAMLAEAEGPVSLLDLPDDLFTEDEMEVLGETRPDLILPVIWGHALQVVAFLQSTKEDHEYGVSEHFALQLLMRVLTEQGVSTASDGASSSPDSPSTDGTADTADTADTAAPEGLVPTPDEPAVLPALLELATGLPMTETLDEFWNEFTNRISKLFQVTTLGYFELATTPEPLVATGRATAGLHKIDLADQRLRSYFCRLERPVRIANFPASFKQIREELEKLGINWVISCNANGRHLGVLALGLQPWVELEDQTDVLARVMAVTTDALGHVNQRQQSADLDLELVQTLILVQEQQRYGSARRTLLLIGLLRVLARDVGFGKDQERDLIYGALLRDIGLPAQTELRAADGKGLDKSQLEVYKGHPEDGLDLLAPLEISDTIRDVVLHHHELFSGKGFPRGLKGSKIPLAARLVAVVERYAELVTGLADQAPMEAEEAASQLRKNSGKPCDPDIVDVFLKTVAPAGCVGAK